MFITRGLGLRNSYETILSFEIFCYCRYYSIDIALDIFGSTLDIMGLDILGLDILGYTCLNVRDGNTIG